MKILHTADWHLGQKFLHFSRNLEHELALNWLLETIQKEKIDILIVAGDIFDVANPPNDARNLYFDFLSRLKSTNCRHAIFIGGNHDAPSTINAPKELLKGLNIHVVGCATDNIEDEIIELRTPSGELEAIIAAVPFLRDKDIRSSISGELSEEREQQIKDGIYNHYQTVGEIVEKYEREDVPILATGHLYATGAEASDRQDNIYIGNMDNIEADSFPMIFDYVALGHIHKAQVVGDLNHVRYSGSLIPLSFSEVQDHKAVLVIHLEGRNMSRGVQTIAVPTFRHLLSFEGDLDSVKQQLSNYVNDVEAEAWVDVIVKDCTEPNLNEDLREFAKDLPLKILKVRTNNQYFALDAQIEEEEIELSDLEPLEVFQKKCETQGEELENRAELEGSFKELLNWMEANQ